MKESEGEGTQAIYREQERRAAQRESALTVCCAEQSKAVTPVLQHILNKAVVAATLIPIEGHSFH